MSKTMEAGQSPTATPPAEDRPHSRISIQPRYQKAAAAAAAVTKEEKPSSSVALAVPSTSQGASSPVPCKPSSCSLTDSFPFPQRPPGLVKSILGEDPPLPRHGLMKRGKKGEDLPLNGNSYVLTKEISPWALHHYNVEFSPSDQGTPAMKILFKEVAKSFNTGYMFDGEQLITSKRLTNLDGCPLQKSQALVQVVTGYRNKGTPEETQYECTIQVKYVQQLKPESPAYDQLYNKLLKKMMRSIDFERIGKAYFNPKAAISLPKSEKFDGLEIWPGYVTTLRDHDMETLWTIDVTHKVLRCGTVLDLIGKIKKNPVLAKDKKYLESAIGNRIPGNFVMTMYNHRIYRVDEVDFSKTPQSTFEAEGAETTFLEYYKKKYGVEIQDLTQPLLVSKPKTKEAKGAVYIVPELCRCLGLSEDMRKDFLFMNKLSKHLFKSPGETVEAIGKVMVQIMEQNAAITELQKWHLAIRPRLVTTLGRVLPNEALVVAEDERLERRVRHAADDKGEFLVALRSNQMLSTVNLENWAILGTEHNCNGVDKLVEMLQKVSTQMNMKISKPKQVWKVKNTSIVVFTTGLTQILKKYTDLQMVMVILPNDREDLYSAVKGRLSVQEGIPSQCFLARNLSSKNLMTIATKMVIQMNAKLGGEPWSIKLPLTNSMFIGFDVYKGVNGHGCVGAMVATITERFSKYFSTTSVYHNADELVKNMQADIIKCLNAYEDTHRGLPERIVMYRHGLENGQLDYVQYVELPAIQKALEERCKVNKPKLTFIVVTKRINTKLLATDDKTMEFRNPGPGTVVDQDVSLPNSEETMNFYLISSAPRHGTVCPCLYNVLLDEDNFGPDRIQQATYKMCHMYYNWTGSVPVPAPVMYARKLANFTGIGNLGEANAKLNKRLHFL